MDAGEGPVDVGVIVIEGRPGSFGAHCDGRYVVGDHVVELSGDAFPLGGAHLFGLGGLGLSPPPDGERRRHRQRPHRQEEHHVPDGAVVGQSLDRHRCGGSQHADTDDRAAVTGVRDVGEDERDDHELAERHLPG